MNLPNFPGNKKYAAAALALLLLLVFSFEAGRYTAPSRIEYKDKLVEKESTTINQKVDLSELKKMLEETIAKSNLHKVTVKKTNVDGSTEETTVTDKSTEVASKTSTDTTLKNNLSLNVKDDKSKVEEHLKIIDRPLKLWGINASAGYSALTTVPGFKMSVAPVLGLGVTRTILGPLAAQLRADAILGANPFVILSAGLFVHFEF